MNDEFDYFSELLVGAESWAIDQVREESRQQDLKIHQLNSELEQCAIPLGGKHHDEVINAWFLYIQRQKEKTSELQRAAVLAKQGRRDEALAIMNQIDNHPVVFDGAPLADAVKALMAERDKLRRKLSD